MMPRKTTSFKAISEGLKEIKAIEKGRKKPSRVFVYSPINVKNVRHKLHCSQSQFAALLRISVKTLQNWEQNRTYPDGPAVMLLAVADKYPEVLLELLSA
jgi:DNA-binding transcriptional regulator YiaG